MLTNVFDETILVTAEHFFINWCESEDYKKKKLNCEAQKTEGRFDPKFFFKFLTTCDLYASESSA